MRQVYLAEDVRLGRRLALKVLSPRALRDEGRLRRFEREGHALSDGTLDHRERRYWAPRGEGV